MDSGLEVTEGLRRASGENSSVPHRCLDNKVYPSKNTRESNDTNTTAALKHHGQERALTLKFPLPTSSSRRMQLWPPRFGQASGKYMFNPCCHKQLQCKALGNARLVQHWFKVPVLSSNEPQVSIGGPNTLKYLLQRSASLYNSLKFHKLGAEDAIRSKTTWTAKLWLNPYCIGLKPKTLNLCRP